MARSQLSGAGKRGLASKPYSPVLGGVVIISTVISILAAWFLAFDFLGYHAPGQLPHPATSVLLLVLGLAMAAVGQLFGAGRNEGIRVRGLLGVIDVLHIRLAIAGIVFIGTLLRYALNGKQIKLYPVGYLAIIAGLFVASRVFTKFYLQIDRRKRAIC